MIVLLAPFAFSGGNVGDLVRTIATWTHKPTVAFVQAQRDRPAGMGGNGGTPLPPEWKPAVPLPSFSLYLTEISDGKAFTRPVRIRTGLDLSVKVGGIALWPVAWDPATTFPQGNNSVPPLPDGWSRAEAKNIKLKGGRVTFDLPPRRAFQVSDLSNLRWPKPISTHLLLKKFWFLPAGSDAGERETLSALAASISGKLVETKDEYRIDLDPGAFRLRAQA